MGEAGNELVQSQLASGSTTGRPHPLRINRQQAKQGQLLFKYFSIASRHHQQRAFQRLWFAAQHWGFQVRATLRSHLQLQLPRFADAHRAHWQAANGIECTQLSNHLCADGPVTQHSNHRLTVLGCSIEVVDQSSPLL